MGEAEVAWIGVFVSLFIGAWVLNWLDLQLKRGFAKAPENRKMVYSFAAIAALVAYFALWAWVVINLARV